MERFYFSESQDAMVLQACHEKTIFWTHKFAIGLTDMGNSESQDQGAQICKQIMAQVDTSRRNWTIVDRDIKINSNERKLNV